MNISQERQGDTLIVAAAGRVDGSNSQEFQQAIEGVIDDNDRAVVLQLKQLSYISSSGLRVMLMVARMLQKRGTKFALCELTESIREVFEISGFDRIISVHDTESAAVAAVAAG
jgi:anti-anti-sigma factor